MDTKIGRPSRRRFIKVSLAGALAVQGAAMPQLLTAAALPRLEESDATAKALAYAHDASAVGTDVRADTKQLCSNCRFYTNADQAWGPCSLFPGKSVAAKGWCKGWVARA